jgi:response regulator of citrate/malate metabolism
MIRTVVVDDDFRVAAIHAAYVAKVDGFEVVAEAHSAAEAVEAVDRLRPDLMLLDLYLPDEHGLKLVGRLRDGDQRTVDRVFGALRAPDQLAGVKGRSVHTLEAVEQLLSGTGEDLSAAEVAERTGMSRATAQRYLSHLHEAGLVDIRLRYGSGRPEHGYRWHAVTRPPPPRNP